MLALSHCFTLEQSRAALTSAPTLTVLLHSVLLAGQSEGDGLFYQVTYLFLEPLCSVLKLMVRKMDKEEHWCRSAASFLSIMGVSSLYRGLLDPEHVFLKQTKLRIPIREELKEEDGD